jgi:hypothetical protein
MDVKVIYLSYIQEQREYFFWRKIIGEKLLDQKSSIQQLKKQKQ